MSVNNLQIETAFQNLHFGLASFADCGQSQEGEEEQQQEELFVLSEIIRISPVNKVDSLIYYQTPDNNNYNNQNPS